MNKNTIKLPMIINTACGELLIDKNDGFKPFIFTNRPDFMILKKDEKFYITPRIKGYYKVALSTSYSEKMEISKQIHELLAAYPSSETLAPYSVAETSLGLSLSKVPDNCRHQLLCAVSACSHDEIVKLGSAMREVLKNQSSTMTETCNKASYMHVLLNCSDLIKRAKDVASLKTSLQKALK